MPQVYCGLSRNGTKLRKLRCTVFWQHMLHELFRTSGLAESFLAYLSEAEIKPVMSRKFNQNFVQRKGAL